MSALHAIRAPLFALCVGCATASSVSGRAEIATINGEHIITMCDSHRRYHLGVSTSNAAPQIDEVNAWLEKGPGPVLVELNGFEETTPSTGSTPDGGTSIGLGQIRALARGSCP